MPTASLILGPIDIQDSQRETALIHCAWDQLIRSAAHGKATAKIRSQTPAFAQREKQRQVSLSGNRSWRHQKSGWTGDHSGWRVGENDLEKSKVQDAVASVRTEIGQSRGCDPHGFTDPGARIAELTKDRRNASVLKRYLGEVRPAATMIQADLIDPAILIEIEVTARRGSGA